MYAGFCEPGKASFLIGGQWGSEGKGAVAASIAVELDKRGQHFDIVTTNAAAQAGHTSTHDGVSRVCFHMPTIPLIARHPDKQTAIYLNAGAIIDIDILLKELAVHWEPLISSGQVSLVIHPRAAVITQECKDEEGDRDSAATAIASTRKGVGAALARKVMRKGKVVADCPELSPFRGIVDLNYHMSRGRSVAVEVPQGQSLSLNGRFYPFTTSRVCSVQQAMADADIHPVYYNKSVMVLRTYPIRVGNIMEGDKLLGTSGDFYHDQHEMSWKELGQTPEITTVTKRVRRVFSPSRHQTLDSFAQTRPNIVFISFCDYNESKARQIVEWCKEAAELYCIDPPEFVFGYGPTTLDVRSKI